MKSSKSATDRTARENAVVNMLANLRLEQLKPSESLSISIQAYIAGIKSTNDLLQEARIKYGMKSSK
jgi:hypothetical protein